MFKQLFILSLFMLAHAAVAQVTFTQLPMDKQLVGRDRTSNLGSVNIAGIVNFSGANYQKIRVECLRNGVLYQAQQQSLDASGATDDFAFLFLIPAELANYSFRVIGLNGPISVLLQEVDEVVAGDVYIIEGQSNAEATWRSDSCYQYASPFIRVYASGIPFQYSLMNNNNWYIAQGDGNRLTNGNTGQWGLKLAREIVDKHQIPVAIFNGAHGGKSIAFFQRPSDYDSSLLSNYARLYYRLKKTGLKDYVRAVFWSQGESDGLPSLGTTTASYKNMFLDLREAWYEDYPAIEGIYIFQTRNGCGSPLHDIMEIKEAQRQLAMENGDIQIISTAELDAFNDNCHFNFVGGYEEFGARLFSLVDRDLYGSSIPVDSDSPLILDAEYVGNNAIRVETNAADLTGLPLVNQFQLLDANGAAITSVYCLGTTYYLQLNGYPGDTAKISHIGPVTGGQGNHIVNSQGIELVCYYRFPVTLPGALAMNAQSRKDFTIYPNPANNTVCVRGTDCAEIALFTMSGERILSDRGSMLSLEHVPNGTYLLRARFGEEYRESKITIQH